ncbi:MAG: spermidine/putrescine ABC transporter substrate-binding protein [Burkholderiaceae bacterium]
MRFPLPRLPRSPQRRQLLQQACVLAMGLTLLPRKSLSAEESRLNFYNWDTYIGDNTLADFREASGIDVRMDLFADNDELFAKFKAGNPGYDVIVPTNDYVERMILADMLLPLDHDKLPNMANITRSFIEKAAFDPGRKYSLPYMWGTIGIGYRKSAVPDGVRSWGALLRAEKTSQRVAMLGAAQYVIGVALKYLGHSFNATDPAQIKQAEDLIIANKKHIRVFADDNGQDLLAAGEVDLVQEWNGDMLQVMGEDKDLAYIVPDEGSMLWEDCLAIPRGAPHPDNAHKFINFLFEPQIGADLADAIQYGTPNAAARKLMPEEYQNNPAIFPSEEVLARCELATYLGEQATRVRDEAWTRIQAA